MYLKDYIDDLKEAKRLNRLYEENENVSMADMPHRSAKAYAENYTKKNKWSIVVTILWIVTALHLAVALILYIIGVIKLQPTYIPNGLLYILFWAAAPFALWIWSTAFPAFNFHNRKIRLFHLAVINAVFAIASQIARFVLITIVPLLLKVTPTTSMVTPQMLVLSCEVITFIASLAPGLAIYSALAKLIEKEIVRKDILEYRVTDSMDTRPHKGRSYDAKFLTNLETGKPEIIDEETREGHSVTIGVTRTGKTSSIYYPSICDDLDQKVRNEEYQKEQIIKMLGEGKVNAERYFDDSDFSIDDFYVVHTGNPKEDKKRDEEFRYLREVCKSAGIMAVGPEATFPDKIREFCWARNITPESIDPELDDNGYPKRDTKGFNPLYIPDGLPEAELRDRIRSVAAVFKDCMDELAEEKGKQDPYFKGLENSVLYHVTVLLCLTFKDVNERQPNPIDVQIAVNDFESLRTYLAVMVKKYGNNGKPMEEYKGYSTTEQLRSITITKSSRINCGEEWQDIFYYVFNRLLDPTQGPVLFDRSEGLRNMMGDFLNIPKIKAVFTRSDMIDIEDVLRKGKILTFNYAINLGWHESATLGRLFLLTFSNAVEKRKKDTKGTKYFNRPYYVYIDEFPRLLLPQFEKWFSFHAGYGLSYAVAIQTTDQFNTPSLQPLKDTIISNCHTKIFFGNLSPNDMKLAEALAGEMDVIQEVYSSTETSLSERHPMKTTSTRETVTTAKRMTGTEMRYRKFQEVTVITDKDKSPRYAFAAKVRFLDDSYKVSRQRMKVNWRPIIDASGGPMPREKETFIPDGAEPYEVVGTLERENIVIPFLSAHMTPHPELDRPAEGEDIPKEEAGEDQCINFGDT